nr:Ig-like domain-containing protein [uncultured Duganella sp.]
MAVIVPSAPFALQSITYSGNTVTLHFDRAVYANNGNFIISDGYAQSYVGASGLSTRIVGATDVHKIDDSDQQIHYGDNNGQDVVITLTSPLKAGLNYSVTMQAGAVKDDANNLNSSISSPKLFAFTADGSASTPPATPAATVNAKIYFTDTGDASDFFTNAQEQTVTGTYSGTLGGNEFVQVSLDNGASWHKATIGSGNSWSYSGEIDTDNLLHGASNQLNGTLLARVSSLEGGSSASASQAYTFSNQPIEIGINSAITLSADTGSSNSDRVTNTAAQTISGTYNGTLLGGQTLQVSIDGGNNWINATTSNQAWQADVTLQSGTHSVIVRAVDGAGNHSSSVESNYQLITSTVSLDGKDLRLAAGSDGGVDSNDGVTNYAQAVTLDVTDLHGFRVGDIIQIIDTSAGSTVVGSYVIQSGDLYYGSSDYLSVGYYNGNARTSLDIDLVDGLVDGTHSLVARVVDVAGNVSAVNSDGVQVVLDSESPVLVSYTPQEGVEVPGGNAVLTYTFDEDIYLGDDVTITVVDNANSSNSHTILSDSIQFDGKTMTIQLPLLTNGTVYSVQGLYVRDLAGNSPELPPLSFTTSGIYNGTPPATPVLSIQDTAPASASAGSAPFTDGITKSATVTVEGLESGSWHYRLSSGADWQLGSGNSLTLPVGTYLANQVEVKQTVNGTDSAIATIAHDITVDTQAFSINTLSGNHFIETSTSVTGTLTTDSAITDQIIEITLDHGISWQQATLTQTDATHAGWSLSGLDLSQLTEYGVRIADTAGNVSTTAYYLTSRDGGYYHPTYDDILLYAGGGIDYIHVGARAQVNGGGGYGDHITTGDDASVVVGNDSTVLTGNGSNFISTGFGAHITTGTGNDTIYCSTIDGVIIRAGLGEDKLTVNTIVDNLVMGSQYVDIQSVETLHFGYSGANVLTINTGASVLTFSDEGKLTITAEYSGSFIHLGAEWVADAGLPDGYHSYHSADGQILLIGQNITVDIATVPNGSI